MRSRERSAGYALVETADRQGSETVGTVASESLTTRLDLERRAARLRWRATLALNVGAAIDSLRSNVFRAGLTVLGVVIGVAAVIVLVAFGEGAQREITAQIDTLGANVAIVMPGKVQGSTNFNPTGGLGVSNITDRDMEAVRKVHGVRRVAPVMFVTGGIYRGSQPAKICMPLATVPEIQEIRRLQMASGRFFRADEMDRQICVLGAGIKKDLFPNEDPVGKKIAVNENEYEVVGVVRDRSIGSGLFGGEELDAIIYLPQTVVRRLTQTTQIHRAFVEVDPSTRPETILAEARQAIQAAHKNRDDFSVVGSKELLSMFYKIFTLMAALLLGITSISLVVGGIGIMNIMLVSVTERTREIGIRKTVGARRGDIFYQFLTEAVALSAFGGTLGIGLAFLVCTLVALRLPLKPVITPQSMALGFGVCVAVGILSGVIPAVAAARKDPIEAIRHE